MRLAASLVVLLLSACSTGNLGAACTTHDDCEDVLICGASEGAPYCTRRCDPERTGQCAEGWSCTPRRGDAARGICTQ